MILDCVTHEDFMICKSVMFARHKIKGTHHSMATFYQIRGVFLEMYFDCMPNSRHTVVFSIG
jgi:hypothetical protein